MDTSGDMRVSEKLIGYLTSEAIIHTLTYRPHVLTPLDFSD